MKESLRTIKYGKGLSKWALENNKAIIERRMKERRHNSRQTKRDRVTLAKIQKELNHE